MVANKNGIAKQNLLQKTSCLNDKPRKVLLGILGFVMAMQISQDDVSIAFKFHNFI
jgi:hypothetical protein